MTSNAHLNRTWVKPSLIALGGIGGAEGGKGVTYIEVGTMSIKFPGGGGTTSTSKTVFNSALSPAS